MPATTDTNVTSNRGTLHDAIDAAHVRAGEARRMAATILETAVRLYSANDTGRGWFWRPF